MLYIIYDTSNFIESSIQHFLFVIIMSIFVTIIQIHYIDHPSENPVYNRCLFTVN